MHPAENHTFIRETGRERKEKEMETKARRSPVAIYLFISLVDTMRSLICN